MLGTPGYQQRMDALTANSDQLIKDFINIVTDDDPSNNHRPKWAMDYQLWYSEAVMVVLQILPHRVKEFEEFYQKDPKRKSLSAATYSISDWLLGTRAPDIDKKTAVGNRLLAQFSILRAAVELFDSSLSNIRATVQADLFDAESDAAKELLRNGFLRPAGMLSGVVLEKHLAEVAQTHRIKSRKQSPTINDFNEALKSAGILDIPTWRRIGYLADLRNLCAHNREREPTKDEVTDLVDEVVKLTKTLF